MQNSMKLALVLLMISVGAWGQKPNLTCNNLNRWQVYKDESVFKNPYWECTPDGWENIQGEFPSDAQISKPAPLKCGKCTIKVDDGDSTRWYFTQVRDGDEISNILCGYVLPSDAPTAEWVAAAFPDHKHGARYYHSRKIAMDYVGRWCKEAHEDNPAD